ncbi:MAG TPA: PAS domain S-box protein [Pyrinomonadaceae bacterium]|jgi:PAS domain S-box-containing protein
MKEDDYSQKSTKEKGQPKKSRLQKRLHTESELEKRLRRAMDAGRIFSWEVNPATRRLEWSSNMEEVIGFRLDENVDKNLEIMHPDDIQPLMDAVQKAIETGEDYESEFRLINPANGEEFWFYSRGAMTNDTADGQPRLTGITRNVTARKRALLYADFLASVSNDLARLRTLDEIMRTVGAQIGNFLKLTGCIFVEIDEADGTATVLHDWRSRGGGRSLIGTYAIADFAAESNYPDTRRGEMFVVRDTRTDERAEEKRRRALGLRSFISVPLFRNGERRFTLVLYDAQPRDWRKDELMLARELANRVWTVIERARAEESLRQSEEQSRLLIEGAIDFAIFRITRDGLIASWNVGAQRVFGYPESEIVGQHLEVLFTPEDRAKKIPAKELKTARRHGRAEDERWHTRRDGSRFYASGVLMRLDEGAKGFVKIARDRTDKLVAEKTLRDKEILQKMVGAQEAERQRIARDLHDELGQQLTALRLKLERIKILCDGHAELCLQIEDAQSLAGNIDQGVDFLAWELRPFVLDDLGLAAALGKFIEEWARHTGVSAAFINLGKMPRRLPHETEINLYRIVQEALNNVHKHAGAARTEVMLEKRGGSIILIVEDDGVGFDPENKKTLGKGLGLIGMRERAALIGGSVEIESATGNGTTIFVRAPAYPEEPKPIQTIDFNRD